MHDESARACRRALLASVAVSAALGCARALTAPSGAGVQAVERWSNISSRPPTSAWADWFGRTSMGSPPAR